MGKARLKPHSSLADVDMAPVPRWFAVYVMPRHEKRVAQHFHVRQIEHFLPLYDAQRRWKNGTLKAAQLPLFPNYLFAKITRIERVSVLEVPSVLWIVGDARDSSALADSYVQRLRTVVGQRRTEPQASFVVGEMVRVKSGPLADLEGLLIRQKGRFRVVVTVELINRSMAVELDLADLEGCCSIHARSEENTALSAA